MRDKIEINMDEYAVRVSVQIYMVSPITQLAEAFGSGFIAKYNNEFFLVSVSHVINYNDLVVTAETNKPPENGVRPLLNVGGLMQYNLISMAETATSHDLLKALEKGGDRLDITFARLNEKPVIFQREIIFKDYLHIKGGGKIIIDLDTEITAEPDKTKLYSFFGYIKPSYDENNILHMTPTLKHNLKYQGSDKYFHRFLTPKIITSKEDFQGCSGAPIIDNDGKFVGLACKLKEGTKLLYGFSAKEFIKLLKISIETGQL